MEEYLLEVEIDGSKDTIKTFARSVEYAVDNIVKLDSVDRLFNIINLDTQESWEFNEDIKVLRDLRNKMPSNVEMFFGVQ